MATKHDIKDTDLHFVIDPYTRSINKQYEGKAHLMQYDHNSESLTFEVPRYIEEHDMSLCDVIQIHYENTSTGTSVSIRKIYRDIETVKREDLTVNEETIEFSWLIPETATTFAGMLKFQLKFICYDDESEDVVGYKWHTDVNEDISIVAGLTYSESTLPDSVKATLQTLEVMETEEGLDVMVGGALYHVYHGGYASEILGTTEIKANKVTKIDESSTDLQYPSARAVQKLFGKLMENGVSVIRTVNGSALKFFVGKQAEYDALENKQDLFAIISDDATKEEIFTAIETLTNTVKGYENTFLQKQKPAQDGLFLYTASDTQPLIQAAQKPVGYTVSYRVEGGREKVGMCLENDDAAPKKYVDDKVVQNSGTSTTKVMSQKAVTDQIQGVVDLVTDNEDSIQDLDKRVQNPTFPFVGAVEIKAGETSGSENYFPLSALENGGVYLARFYDKTISPSAYGATTAGVFIYNSDAGYNRIGLGHLEATIHNTGRVSITNASDLNGSLSLYKLGKLGES